MAHDVFISHASDDKATADAVVATLEQRQIRCWIAPRDIPPGKDYAEALVQAINGSRVLVLVFSAKANSSPHVMREIERAASRGIPILPLRIEDVKPSESMEYFISGRHWLDALTTPLRRHLDQLASSVASLLEAEGGDTTATETPQAAADGSSEGEPPSAGILGRGGRWRERPILIGVAAAAIALVAIIGGFFILQSGGDGDEPPAQVQGGPTAEGPEVQVVNGHFSATLVAQVVDGDCITGNLIIKGEGKGEFTGDISGDLIGAGEIITYVAAQCQKGFFTIAFTLTDPEGNTISGDLEGPIDTVSFLSNGLPSASNVEPIETTSFGSSLILVLTGGTGIYRGVTGTGTCSTIIGGTYEADGSVLGSLEGDCTFELTTIGASVAGLDPVIIQLAASSLEVAVSPGPFDPVSAVAVAVLYGNTQEEELTGLSVKLLVPEGAEILGATLEEAQPVSAGERIWQLPDLAVGELTRFEFLVQIQAAETPTIPLIVEVNGEGFDQPIPSDPVMFEVVQ